jgi:hypothetical protein
MASDREERNTVFGMPRDADPYARQGEEPQRVLGIPVDWYGPVDQDLLHSLRHPIKACKHWALRRRLGPFAPEEGDPEPEGPAGC